MDGKNGELANLKSRMAHESVNIPEGGIGVSAENLTPKEEMGGWRVKVPISDEGGISLGVQYGQMTKKAEEVKLKDSTLEGSKTEADTTVDTAETANESYKNLRDGDKISLKKVSQSGGSVAEGDVLDGEMFMMPDGIQVGKSVRIGSGKGITNTSRVKEIKHEGGKTYIVTENSTYELNTPEATLPKNEEPKVEEVKPVTKEDGLDANRKQEEVKNKKREPEDPEKKREGSEAFGKAKAEWKEARDHSDSLQRELYGDKEKGTVGKYTEFLAQESKGWRKFVNLPRRFLGLQPKLSRELRDLEGALRVARKEYFEKAVQLKDLKNSPDDSLYVKNQKVLERYQRLLAHKLIVGVNEKKVAIQENQALENDKNSRIKPALMLMRKYRYVRWGATAAGYAVLAGATGGVASAAIAGGAYAARLGGGMALGGLVGSFTRVIGADSERMALKDIQDGNTKVKTDLFKRGFSDSEAEINEMIKSLEKTRAISRGTAATAAVAAGFAGGNLAGIEFDNLASTPPATGVEPPESAKPPTEINPEPPVKGEVTTPPASGGGEGGVTTPPESGGGSETPAKPETPPVEGGETEGGVGEGEEVEPGSETEEEVAPAEIKHTVVRGDNAWNIMEGKGPDANPVGGKSQVLQDMNFSLQERQYWLDKLFDYCDQNPEFAKEVGAVKSGGNIHLIHPGETVDVSMLDEKLLELMHQDHHTGEVPTPTPRPEDLGSSADTNAPDIALQQPDVEGSGSALSQSVDQILKSENPINLNNLTIDEFTELVARSINKDPDAINYFTNQGYDGHTLREMVDTLDSRKGITNPNMTISEFLTTSEKSSLSRTPEGAPYGNYKMVDNYPPVAEVSASVETPDVTPVSDTGQIVVKSPLGEDVTINMVDDVNKMNLTEAGYLYNAIKEGDPNVVGFLNSMGTDSDSFIDLYDSLDVRAEYDPNMTVGEWLNVEKGGPESNAISPTTSEGASEEVVKASVSPEQIQQNLANYVNKVEPSGLFESWFGTPPKAFDKIADLNFGQINEYAQNGNLEQVADQLGVSDDVYSKWMNTLQEEVAKVPPLSGEETVRQYLTRINSGVSTA